MSRVPSRRLNALVEFSDLSDDDMPWIAVLPRTRVPVPCVAKCRQFVLSVDILLPCDHLLHSGF